MKRRIGDDVWNSYFKFCIVRNPWDRFLSFYHQNGGSRGKRTVSEVLDRPVVRKLRSKGVNLMCIDGTLAVNRVCRFERLTEDLEEVRLQLGLPEPLDLPRAKGKTRTDRRHYREVLTDAERDRIAELLREEIELFGYEY